MATDFKLKLRSGTPVTAMTTELNSLANSSAAIASSATVQDSTSDEDFYCDAELVVPAFASAPAADQPIDLYFIQTIDGTNYEDNATGASPAKLPADAYVRSFLTLGGSATAQRLVLRGLRMPSRDFKAYLYNRSGQAFGASSNTLKLLPYKETGV